ncbi:carbohydrate-binding protein [Neorhizobium petrolearium]|uniref:carbohydrate-binding protein n=1 Tax=Neorhizobium petrolearium TaxID=515361 RepID=UPI003F8171B4
MELTLKVLGLNGTVLASATGKDEVFLVYRQDYQEGDQIVVMASEPGHVVLALDDTIGSAAAYLKGPSYSLKVPFGDKRACYSPRAFQGDIHRLHVRKARPDEIASRRNLALNPWDDHANTTLFPHAKANAETRGEAVFAARNVIDGEKANDNHGFWPYTSWGINRNPEATLTVGFGRPVWIDELVFYLRADFPHDSWWKKASITFSNGETTCFPLAKSGAAQSFSVRPRTVEWIRLHSLVKAEDPSFFPALTQIEVWGRDVA